MSRIVVEHQNQILVISLNRTEKRNALTNDMYDDMAIALEQAAQDSQCKAVLIQGFGEAFTAGNDLAQFANAEDEENVGETVRFMHALMECPVPVVAKVHGMAVGIGTTLLLHCDLVYASTDTTFSMPFINLALVPEYASSWMLPRLVGHRKAAEWLMLGKPFGPEEAKHFGLINEVFEEPQLSEEVNKVLQTLCSKPALAMKRTKALMKTDLEDVQVHMSDELDVFASQLSTEPAKEAFAAFLEKRLPDPTKFR